MQEVYFFVECTLKDYKRRVKFINQEAWKYHGDAQNEAPFKKHLGSFHFPSIGGHKRHVVH